MTNDTTITLPRPSAPIDKQSPAGVARADVYSGKAPLVENFVSFGSIDPNGTIVSYAWDFMDGSMGSKETNPSHEFNTPDKYLVTLSITDVQGLTNSVQVEITVKKGKGKS